jgi:transcription initiation factor TFIIIB Brf1 subunit/transcription initiation factor TFIIB
VNAITQVSAPIAEAMTSAELTAACEALSAHAGNDITTICAIASTGRYSNGETACLIITYNHYKENKHLKGRSWTEVFAAAYAWAQTRKAVRRNSLIRTMALAIIELTDEHGGCAERRLTAKGFSGEEIAEFHEAACARASEMCANAPFAVLMGAA